MTSDGEAPSVVRIGVVGDYRAGHETHLATSSALAHAATASGCEVEVVWLATPELAGASPATLAGFDGLLVAPGSPYRSLEGALRAIEVARTTGVPLLGTCGGFQHVVLEYARNVLGMVDADHAEYEPDAPRLFVDALECSLAGLAMAVTLRPGTVAAVAYEASSATERYYCNFGLNPRYRDELEAAGLRVSGTDQDGAVRIVELPEAGFFVGTLFVPQVSSTPDASHPLVRSFVAAAEARHRPRDLSQAGGRKPQTRPPAAPGQPQTISAVPRGLRCGLRRPRPAAAVIT